MAGQGDMYVAYRKEEYEKKISETQNNIKQLQSLVSQLEGKRKEIKSFWEDQDADRYDRLIRQEIDKCNESIANAQEMVGGLQKIVDSLEEAASDVNEMFDDAEAIVDTLLN